MADVRLTATNPDDSSVVPVACNEKGELKLEEPLVVEGPPGNKGDKGDKGDAGDPFSGNFSGNVTFEDGYLLVLGDGTGDPWNSNENQQNTGVFLGNTGRVNLYSYTNSAESPLLVQRVDPDNGNRTLIAQIDNDGNYRNYKNNQYACIKSDGTAILASNKAGFTAEGYLWCTTRRGDTVILDFTSNGMGMWEPYTPPVLRDGIKERWAEKNGTRPMPEESSQDESETKTLRDCIRDQLEDGSTTDIDSLRPKGD